MAANLGNGLIVSFDVSLAEASWFLKAPGGAPANVVVSRLGEKSTFVSNLVDDEFGHMLAGILKEKGVSADDVTFDKGARTGLACVSIWENDDIKVSDVELEFLTWSNKIENESAMSLWHPKLQLLLVTLGDKGCRVTTRIFEDQMEGILRR